MGVLRITENLLAPQVRGPHVRDQLGVWWDTSGIVAVHLRADATPVDFDGRPVLAVTGEETDIDLWWRLLNSAGVSPGPTLIVAAVPLAWGPERRARWHRAAEDVGIGTVRTVPYVDVIAALGNQEASTVQVTAQLIRPDRLQIAAMRHAEAGMEVLAHHTVNRADASPGLGGLDHLVTEVLSVADVPASPITFTALGEPAVTRDLVAELHDLQPVAVHEATPLELATTVLDLDLSRQPEAVPERPHSSSVLSALAAALVCLLLAGMVIDDARVGYDPYGMVAFFSPGHLAVAATGLAVTSVATAMLLVHWLLARRRAWDWGTAGAWLMGGAGIGLVAAAATGLVLASTQGTQPRGPLLWAVLPALPLLAAYAGIGAALHTRPWSAPVRQIWPPMLAITLAAIGVWMMHASEPIFAQMPTFNSVLARVGFAVLAIATGIALSSRPAVATITAVALASVYALAASPGTGTVACVAFIAAVTIRAGMAWAGIVHDQQASDTTKPRDATPSLARRSPVTGH